MCALFCVNNNNNDKSLPNKKKKQEDVWSVIGPRYERKPLDTVCFLDYIYISIHLSKMVHLLIKNKKKI